MVERTETDPVGAGPTVSGVHFGVRRPVGSGTVTLGRDGDWTAKIYLKNGRRISWRRHTQAEAEAALPLMVEKHRMEVGASYYRYYIHGLMYEPRRVRPLRSGVSNKVRWQVLERDGHRCRYCGATAPETPLVIDHVLPVARGGTDDIDNLAAACVPCNNGKAASELRLLESA